LFDRESLVRMVKKKVN